MAPQDDLTAERAAIALLEQMGLYGHPAASQFIGDILAALKTDRQEALRDVLSDLDSLHWKDHWYADQLRKKINDRLASEEA